jgi:competence protein ComEC
VACLFFVIGVGVALIARIPGWVGIALFPFFIILFFNQSFIVLICGGLIALLIGLSFGASHLVSRDVYKLFLQKSGVVQGRVKEDVSKSASGSYSLQLDTVVIDDTRLPGTILATGRSTGGALRGDVVTLRGQVRDGFGSFPATVSTLEIIKVERSPFGDVGRVIRDGFADKVRQVIPEPQASLGIGFLTGQKSALSEDLSNALKIAGLTHIVVASGYNLTILVRMARKLFLKVSKYLSALSASIMIVSFVMITGLSPSMTRAGLVSGMSLLSWYYGHAFHPFVLLPVAMAITVAMQPSYVWGDMGWQLSFSAFAGVMIVAPLLQAYFFGKKEPGMLRQILGETIAAHIVTIPIIALSFGTISNVAIIANLLVVPLVPIAMLLTFVCGMVVLIGVPFGEWVALPTTWLLQYMTSVATIVAELPWAQSALQVHSFVWLGYGALVAFLCGWMWRLTKYNFRTGQPTAC